MKIQIQKDITARQKQSILKLWNEEYPIKLHYTTIAELDKYLDGLIDKTYFLLINNKEEITGWATTFIRENQKWFSILLQSSIQGKGYGKMLIDKLKEKEDSLLGWVIDHNEEVKANGSIYYSPLPFYEKNGFVVQPEIRLESDKMSAVRIEWKKQF